MKRLLLSLLLVASIPACSAEESGPQRPQISDLHCNNFLEFSQNDSKVEHIRSWAENLTENQSLFELFPASGEMKQGPNIRDIGLDWDYLNLDPNIATLALYPRGELLSQLGVVELVSVGQGRNFITVSLSSSSPDPEEVFYPGEGLSEVVNSSVTVRCFY